MSKEYTQWSTLDGFTQPPVDSWVPDNHQARVKAYTKYDQLYWNDKRAYQLRTLEGEQPIYVPNARTIVDTTSHYLLKDILVKPQEGSNTALQMALNDFLIREQFYSRFMVAKHAGVAKGDFVLHMTANPNKVQGTRISLVSLDPSIVFPEWDPDSPDRMIACHLVNGYQEYDEKTRTYRNVIRKLSYTLVKNAGGNRVRRREAIYKLDGPSWWSEKAETESLVRVTIPDAQLPDIITSIPVYWFKNMPWGNQVYGSSDLRGVEGIIRAISQGTTDTNAALALEGLGVYATDGGRPIDSDGKEVDWDISPGRVMEVPIGSKFWRVQGVGSIVPMKDQIDRLEGKMRESSALTDVALGQAQVNVASSGIALAIQFTPTLAKIEERDLAGIAKLNQLFYDWVEWTRYFEQITLAGEIVVELGSKLPINRSETITELNNMIDRKVISSQYYREQMLKLGYVFPDDIEQQIERDVELALRAVPVSQTDQSAVDNFNNNSSNNAGRPNESSGTEIASDDETSS